MNHPRRTTDYGRGLRGFVNPSSLFLTPFLRAGKIRAPLFQEKPMRRSLLWLFSFAIMAIVVGVALQFNDSSPLAWAQQGKITPAPVAVLIEMGLKDVNVRDWSGQATVQGAKVVHREGYRFWLGDQITGIQGWQAS